MRYWIICIFIFFITGSTIACNQSQSSGVSSPVILDENSNAVTLEVLDDEVAENFIHPAEDFDEKNALEIRGKSLWLGYEDLNKLTLDGQVYYLDLALVDVKKYDNFTLAYPLLIHQGQFIYDLELGHLILSLDDIIADLAQGGYSGGMKAEDFSFIDQVLYDSGHKNIALSLHANYADIMDSQLVLYDLKKGLSKFLDQPFYGQVMKLLFTEGDQELVFTYYTGGDRINNYLQVVASQDLSLVYEADLNDIFQETMKLKEGDVYFEDAYMENEILFVRMLHSHWDGDKNIKKEGLIRVWQKEVE